MSYLNQIIAKGVLYIVLVFSISVSAQNANPLKEKMFFNVDNAILENTKTKQLNLRDQQLFFLPEGISQLKELVFFNGMKNYLEHWDPNIFKLKKLKTINFKENSLIQIPEDIKELSDLESLDLANNAIKK